MDKARTAIATTTATDPLDLPVTDLSQRSVKVLRKRINGFVEFEFSLGWPELVVWVPTVRCCWPEVA